MIISDDLIVGIDESEETSVLTIVAQEGYRQSHHISFINDEINVLYKYLKEHFESSEVPDVD